MPSYHPDHAERNVVVDAYHDYLETLRSYDIDAFATARYLLDPMLFPEAEVTPTELILQGLFEYFRHGENMDDEALKVRQHKVRAVRTLVGQIATTNEIPFLRIAAVTEDAVQTIVCVGDYSSHLLAYRRQELISTMRDCADGVTDPTVLARGREVIRNIPQTGFAGYVTRFFQTGFAGYVARYFAKTPPDTNSGRALS